MHKLRLVGIAAAASGAFVLATFVPTIAIGQDAPAQGKGKGPAKFEVPKAGTIPRTADGQPDLNGVWLRPYTPDMTKGGASSTPSTLNFTPWGKQQWESYRAEEGDYTGSCLPFGLIRSINAPHPMQIVQSKNWIAFLHEQNTWFTKIRTDGWPHPKDLDATWFGDSRGTWKDGILTIDTVGFNGKTRLDTIGHPHSDQMHVVESWKLTNENQVYYTILIEDPKTYADPLKSERIFTRIPDSELRLHPEKEVTEYSCEENNKSLFEGRIKAPDYSKWK